MKLHELHSAEGSRRNRKRVGRGTSSGYGKTAGRGQKGQLARQGGHTRLGFEGGQMPLFRTMPKRGFKNINRKEYAIVNLDDLNKFEDGSEVTVESLKDNGLVKKELLTRNFLWSLMNSTTSRQLTIQDQAYLMKLFQERMYVWNSSMRLVDQLKPYFLLEEEEEWLKEYLQTYQYQKQMKEIYEEYLDTYYDQETFHQIYQTIDLEHMELSDAFTPQEKNFIQELVDELAYQRSTILENQVQKIKAQKVASLQ